MSGNHHRSLSFMPTCTLRNAISNQSNFVPTLQQVLKRQSREIFIQFKVLLKVLYSTVSELRCIIIVFNINCNLTIIEGWTEVKRSLACLSTADCWLLFESMLLLSNSATPPKKLERNVSEFSKPLKMVLKSSSAGVEVVI